MSWSEVQFGKHKGKTLPQVLCSDPDWFFWAIENNVFKNKGSLKVEADNLNQLARKIKIPGNPSANLEAEYLIHSPTGKFSHFNVVSAQQSLHQGSSPTYRLNVIDMSVPRQIAPYDKFGCKELLTSIKKHLFGNSKTRLTKKRCEDFFDNQNNFI